MDATEVASVDLEFQSPMRFNRAFIFSFCLWLPSLSLEANSQAFGIIVRQSFVDKMLEVVNRNSPVDLEFCTEAKDPVSSGFLANGPLYLEVNGSFQIQSAEWQSVAGELVQIDVALGGLNLDLSLYSGCPSPEEALSQLAHLTRVRLTNKSSGEESLPVLLRYNINPKDLEAEMLNDDDVVTSFQKALAITALDENGTEIFEGTTAFINLPDSVEVALEIAKITTPQLLSNLLRKQLRGLVYVDSLSQMMEKHPTLSQKEIQLDQKLFSLRNTGINRRRDVGFAFFPRSNQSVFAGRDQLELYLNAQFISDQGLRQLNFSRGLEEAPLQTRLSALKTELIESNEPVLPDAPFIRPNIRTSDSDITLVLPEGLINQGLETFHLSALLDFEGIGDLGELAKGVLFEKHRDVQLHVGLGSYSAPLLRFETNRLQLNVEDYYVSTGIRMKGRVIPTAELQASVQVRAQPQLTNVGDIGLGLNLLIQPDSFLISLSDEGRFEKRFSQSDLDLIGDLARRVWTSFFKKYPELFLMTTVFEQAPLEPVGMEVLDQNVLLHFNYDTEEREEVLP